ncbi:MAG: hypothetical protein QGF28_04845 [Candidatus Thalassarchaeaceae archaeon]|nr:hypothetical protein [Euryarchaeota archaeon]MDP7092277.1 hypothetical protein [Candidatus Thalassarchaeaceae archaeon]MBV43336.1 hypothetical protein [Euryarchaeota archaeon]MDP7257497.1 hypothetical protein [Candidatus Thalassarchaeaceae archaeon]MDP7446508.1 hypothetical protein [Candidatus Thalassarchaeaceae archaeon]
MSGSSPRGAGAVVALLVIIVLSPMSAQGEEVNSCCETRDFKLFLVGESDEGELTPFDFDLDEEKSFLVTPSIWGEVNIGAWSVIWGADGEYTAGTWIFNIPYEVVDATGVTANATVLIKVGGSTYESSSEIPAVYLTNSGELQVSVDIGDGEISEGEEIEISLSVQGLVFSNPGSESGIRFLWGSTQSDASLSLSFPLVHIEMKEASVKGNLAFFPIKLTSAFGNKMWSGSSGGFSIQNTEVGQSPITTALEDGVEVTFVWEIPDGFGGGSLRADFYLSPQPSLRIETDKNHQITAGVDSGGTDWYPAEEPSRIGGSELEVNIACEYDGDSIDRDTSISFDGAMSQWMRWGLDNIGNKSLGSSSWWKNLNSYSDSVSSSDKQNGRVDDSEILALQNHLTGSRADLRSFLSNGLFLDPEGIFGVNPIDFGPMDIVIDLGGSTAFNSEVISITISASYEVGEGQRQRLIEDFIRPGGNDYWAKVDLDFEISTGMLSGLGAVYSETDDISYSHRRWIVMEILFIEESGIDSEADFRIDFASPSSLVYSPLVSAMIAVFALCLAIGIALALTKRRTRVPSMIMVSVLGVLTLVIYWFGLPMQIVLGVVASSVLLVFPVTLISPTDESMEKVGGGPTKVGKVRCPSCGAKNKVESNVRPLRLDCSECRSTLRIE